MSYQDDKEPVWPDPNVKPAFDQYVEIVPVRNFYPEDGNDYAKTTKLMVRQMTQYFQGEP